MNYRRAEPLPSGRVRRVTYGTVQLATLLLVTMPLAVAAAVAILIKVPVVSRLAAADGGNLLTAAFYQEGLVASAVSFIGAILLGAAVVLTVPHVLSRFITPGRAYPLYGLRHWVHRAIGRLTNIKFYLELLGDSSFAVGYLRALGYRMRDVEQTGSNFGADLAHENPFLVDIGRGTMVADGATFIDADYSSTSFCVTPLSIGPHNFLGNAVAYPAGARTGENCLIATKAMVPLDGPVQDNVGLLGSPCFQIPGPPLPTIASTTSGPGRNSIAGYGRRTGTTSPPWGCSWPCGGCTCSSSPCSPWRRGRSTTRKGLWSWPG